MTSQTEAPCLYRPPYTSYGLHKTATTILADQGDVITVVNDIPRRDRPRERPPVFYRGARPMHRTTLRLAHQTGSSYATTHSAFHGGQRDMEPYEKPRPFPSQHIPQRDYLHKDPDGKLLPPTPAENYYTHYHTQFPSKEIDESARSYHPALDNKIRMAQSVDVNAVMTTPNPDQGRYQYWTQYNRIHNKLGAVLGTGVPKERPPDSSYCPLTGVALGPRWKSDNRSRSANRTLYRYKRYNTGPIY